MNFRVNTSVDLLLGDFRGNNQGQWFADEANLQLTTFVCNFGISWLLPPFLL